MKRPVRGAVKWARLISGTPPFRTSFRLRGAQRRGVLYERAVNTFLLTQHKDGYLPSPWLQFEDDWKVRYCQPDGVLISPWTGIITIIEVKYQHVAAAWLQLQYLYLPVLAKLFETKGGIWSFATVEVVKWYDPHTECPKRPSLCRDVTVARPGEFGVFIWKP